MSVFWCLEVGAQSFVDYGYGNDWEGIVCPLDPNHQRAGRRTTTLRLEIERQEIVDFSSTTLADVVITDRALKCMQESGLNGIEAKSIELVGFPRNWQRSLTPTLWELIVKGTAGHAHEESGIRLLRRCNSCGSTKYSAYEHGIVVDESNWDGSDFFTVVEYPKHYLVSERAKKTIEANRLTNVQFIPSHLLKWPGCVVKPE